MFILPTPANFYDYQIDYYEMRLRNAVTQAEIKYIEKQLTELIQSKWN